ncbi:MAG: DUF1587 domain-containing protein, partial [Fimbriiglobus sp.]
MTVRRRLLWLPLPAVAGCFVVGFATARLTAQPAPVPTTSPTAKMVPTAAPNPATPADPTFERKIVPFLAQHCDGCHNSEKQAGGVPLDIYVSEAHARKDRKMWETIRTVVADGAMPPKKKPQPSAAEKAFFVGWVENTLLKIDCTAPKDPGRVTLRRLNRAEYDNTVRDLCGVDFQPADDFPSDDVG